jgi:hypothetical protein
MMMMIIMMMMVVVVVVVVMPFKILISHIRYRENAVTTQNLRILNSLDFDRN